MTSILEQESEKLTQSWMRHDSIMLREYLVSSVEDPRINLQSVFARHFIVRALAGERFSHLMEHECRFAAVMNWLAKATSRFTTSEEFAEILYGLKRKADRIEGVEIPHFVSRTFGALPAVADSLTISNYIEAHLSCLHVENGHQPSLDTFCNLWRGALAKEAIHTPKSVLEPACGSANDYRFLHAYGIANLVDYTGVDLCAKNIENSRALFPGIRFNIGNVFEISAPDKHFELCVVQDLFEHLSLTGMNAAVAEICRVTRQGLCLGFFNMDEISAHIVRPVEQYHWNTLSMASMRESFASHGFSGQVIHIGSFLRESIGCQDTHNLNAYTFILRASP